MKKDKKLRERMKEENIHAYDDHPLVTRRDFLAAGLINYTAILTAPTIFGLLGKKAFAQALDCPVVTTTVASSVPAVVHLHLAGGPSIMGALPWDRNGERLDASGTTGYGRLGYGVNAKSESWCGIDWFARKDMAGALVPNETYVSGLKRLDAAAADRTALTSYGALTQFIKVPVQSMDDSRTNPFRISGLINVAGLAGSTLPYMQSSGFGHSPVLESNALLAPPATLIVQSYNSILNQLRPQGPVSALGDPGPGSRLSALYELIGNFNLAQMPSKSQDSTKCLIKNAGDFNNKKATTSLASVQNMIDARKNAAMRRVWGITEDQNPGDMNVVFASMVYNVLQGTGGMCELQVGGRDYHNNTRTTGDAADFSDGVLMAKILQSAAELGKKLCLVITADGATQPMAGDTTDGAVWVSDKGEFGQVLLAIVDPTQNPSAILRQKGATGVVAPNQINYVNTSGAAARPQDNLIPGWGTELAMLSVFANILAFGGQESWNLLASKFPAINSTLNAAAGTGKILDHVMRVRIPGT